MTGVMSNVVPIILPILLDFADLFKTNAILVGIYTTIQYIANLGTPLILLII